MKNAVDVIFFNEETHEIIEEEHGYYSNTSEIIEIVDRLKSECEKYPFKVAYIVLYDIYNYDPYNTEENLKDFNEIIDLQPSQEILENYDFNAVKNLNCASIIFINGYTYEIIDRYDGEFEEKSDIYDLVNDFYEDCRYFNKNCYDPDDKIRNVNHIVLYDNWTYPKDCPHPKIGQSWRYNHWCDEWYGEYMDDLINCYPF